MPPRQPTVPAKPGAAAPKSATQKALDKLGLKRDIDLALHLPLRYEDETRIVKLRDVREGDTAQIGPRDPQRGQFSTPAAVGCNG